MSYWWFQRYTLTLFFGGEYLIWSRQTFAQKKQRQNIKDTCHGGKSFLSPGISLDFQEQIRPPSDVLQASWERLQQAVATARDEIQRLGSNAIPKVSHCVL